MRFGGTIRLWLVAMSMVVSEKVHQRTCQKKQIGCRRKGVARVRRQQVNAERCRNNSYSQPKLRAEKTAEYIHDHSCRILSWEDA